MEKFLKDKSENTGSAASAGSGRIWELDALRGIAIICVCIIHYFTQLSLVGGRDVQWLPFFWFVKQYWGAIFVIISGICVAFSHSSFRRGLIVMGCGLALTALTYWLYLSGREGDGVLIQWGTLHLIGFCMMLYPLLKKLPAPALFGLGAAIIVCGYYCMANVRVFSSWLFPFGLRTYYFTAFDWFPIMPYLGWFMTGIGLKRLIYKEKRSLLPRVNERFLPLRFLCACGRHSLEIFMIHQPLFYLIISGLYR